MPGRSTGGARDQASSVSRDLWVCLRCGRTFANRNQTHACRPLADLDQHFTGKDPLVRAAFDAVLTEVRRLGPVTVLPQSTRIALHVRMSFAAFVPRRHWLDGHVVLARRVDHHGSDGSSNTRRGTCSTGSACSVRRTSMLTCAPGWPRHTWSVARTTYSPTHPTTPPHPTPLRLRADARSCRPACGTCAHAAPRGTRAESYR
jgi:hypothetical protein